MNPTSIEKTPPIYELPTLLVKPQRSDITPINIPVNYYFQYIFNFNLDNVIDTSSCNLYPLIRKLNLSGDIQYYLSPISVYLNGSSYLSTDIAFDIKSLSFFFKLENVNDNYLLSTVDNDFYIKVNSTVLSIKVNTDIINITNDFIADNWYHLVLTYNGSKSQYDIYSNNSILPEKINNLITNLITLNIGKKSGVFDTDGNIDTITTHLSGTTVSRRTRSSMVAIGTDIYIYGGYNGVDLNDFYKIDTTTFVVTKIKLTGDITERNAHSMVAIGTYIYIFGGYDISTVYLNDFYKIDTNNITLHHEEGSSSVSVTKIDLDAITGRYGHSMVAIGDNIYIFGGDSSSGRLNDFYKIDTTTTTFVVTKINLTGDIITGERRYHSMVAIGDNIYIYGGYNSTGFYLNDFYKIDTNNITAVDADSFNVTVEKIENGTSTTIHARSQHSMVAIGTDIYIYGGYVDTNVDDVVIDYYGSNLFKIDTVGETTKRIELNGTNPGMYGHSMVEINGNIYIFGGDGGSGISNDFYKITRDSYFTGNIADLRLYNYQITAEEIQYIKLPEPTIYIQYDFDNTLDKSPSSIYGDALTLNGDIQYYLSPISVYLNGSSYLSTDITFDLKTLSFWFKPINVNIDNYLLSTDDNIFYIKVNSNELSIKVNTDTKNIISDFTADNWYHLVLTYNESKSQYDIYIDNSISTEKIYSLISNFITLNIGKKSGVFDTDDLNVIEITVDGFDEKNLGTLYNLGRYDHSMVAIGTDIYIFGGRNRHGTVFNDFYKINTINCNVVYSKTFTDIPERSKHSMVAIETDIYIFGGASSSWEYLNDFYKIDTIICNVVYSDTDLNDISARRDHSMVAIGTDIYIFGGYNDTTQYMDLNGSAYYNDFYKIDTIICNVVYSDTNLNDISVRYGHSIMVAIGTDIYIYGGDGGNTRNDFYKIDTNNCNVVYSDLNLDGISKRKGHSMVVIDTDIYIFGGYNNGTNLVDFYKISTINCNVVYSNTDLNGISARLSHSMVAIGTDIYIYGGRNSTTNIHFNDFYKIATVYDSYFTGNIADLRLYNYSITQQEIEDIKLPELTIYIQYDFDNTLDKSSSSIYGDSLTSSGDIEYHLSPNSVYLNGSSYLSTDIAFDLKTLSFWFNPENVNIDNYLLSTDDNNFYIKVNSNELSIKVNTDTKNITNVFTTDNWYHLVLTYNEPRYDIYIDNSISTEKIYSLITKPITLNIGKKSEVPVNSDDLNVIQITPDGFDNYITTKINHSMVAIDTDIYIFGDNVHFNKIDTINCNVVYRNTAFTDISARRYYSMVAIGTDIYIYGGVNSSWIPFNDFYKINTITCNVVHSDTNLYGISARGGYSMVAIDPYIYIFGGSSSKIGSFKNDFYKINTINCNVVYSNTFTNISARRDHSMVAIGTDIYIFGGRNSADTYLNDFYKIDTIDCNVVYSTTFTNISGREFASIVAIDTDIYIYGGYSFDTSTIFNDFYKISTIDCNVVYSNNDFTDFTDISARYLHSMAAIGTDIYIYGGRNSANTYLNDFYKIATVYDSYFTGNIADLRLYNYQITAEEIITIYNDLQ